nr:MAG TPA: hypothetical protein [Caudoviricetes sp.]
MICRSYALPVGLSSLTVTHKTVVLPALKPKHIIFYHCILNYRKIEPRSMNIAP